jgi:hypothetical protein
MALWPMARWLHAQLLDLEFCTHSRRLERTRRPVCARGLECLPGDARCCRAALGALHECAVRREGSALAGVTQGERHRGVQGGSEEPLGPLITHLHTVYMAYSECLPIHLNPMAERTCFSQM